MSCGCGTKQEMVFACSGGSDVGGLSDRVAREYAKTYGAKMYCLAGLGADLANMIETAKKADGIVAVDGCPVGCAKKLLANKGLTARSVELSAMGFEKGKVSADVDVGAVADRVRGEG